MSESIEKEVVNDTHLKLHLSEEEENTNFENSYNHKTIDSSKQEETIVAGTNNLLETNSKILKEAAEKDTINRLTKEIKTAKPEKSETITLGNEIKIIKTNSDDLEKPSEIEVRSEQSLKSEPEITNRQTFTDELGDMSKSETKVNSKKLSETSVDSEILKSSEKCSNDDSETASKSKVICSELTCENNMTTVKENLIDKTHANTLKKFIDTKVEQVCEESTDEQKIVSEMRAQTSREKSLDNISTPIDTEGTEYSDRAQSFSEGQKLIESGTANTINVQPDRETGLNIKQTENKSNLLSKEKPLNDHSLQDSKKVVDNNVKIEVKNSTLSKLDKPFNEKENKISSEEDLKMSKEHEIQSSTELEAVKPINISKDQECVLKLPVKSTEESNEEVKRNSEKTTLHEMKNISKEENSVETSSVVEIGNQNNSEVKDINEESKTTEGKTTIRSEQEITNDRIESPVEHHSTVTSSVEDVVDKPHSTCATSSESEDSSAKQKLFETPLEKGRVSIDGEDKPCSEQSISSKISKEQRVIDKSPVESDKKTNDIEGKTCVEQSITVETESKLKEQCFAEKSDLKSLNNSKVGKVVTTTEKEELIETPLSSDLKKTSEEKRALKELDQKDTKMSDDSGGIPNTSKENKNGKLKTVKRQLSKEKADEDALNEIKNALKGSAKKRQSKDLTEKLNSESKDVPKEKIKESTSEPSKDKSLADTGALQKEDKNILDDSSKENQISKKTAKDNKDSANKTTEATKTVEKRSTSPELCEAPPLDSEKTQDSLQMKTLTSDNEKSVEKITDSASLQPKTECQNLQSSKAEEEKKPDAVQKKEMSSDKKKTLEKPTDSAPLQPTTDSQNLESSKSEEEKKSDTLQKKAMTSDKKKSIDKPTDSASLQPTIESQNLQSSKPEDDKKPDIPEKTRRRSTSKSDIITKEQSTTPPELPPKRIRRGSSSESISSSIFLSSSSESLSDYESPVAEGSVANDNNKIVPRRRRSSQVESAVKADAEAPEIPARKAKVTPAIRSRRRESVDEDSASSTTEIRRRRPSRDVSTGSSDGSRSSVKSTDLPPDKAIDLCRKRTSIDERMVKLQTEGKCSNKEKAFIAAKLIEMQFEEEDALNASRQCSSVYHAVKFLTQLCELCQCRFPVNMMASMVHCTHRVCKECLRAHFTSLIYDRNMFTLLCPVCHKPDITDQNIQEYFNHLDQMLRNILDTSVYDMFQRKLRDEVLTKDPNFHWCSQCSSGFIASPRLKKLYCPDCSAITCSSCHQTWEPEHEGVHCERFQQWKDMHTPEPLPAGLVKYLTDRGITCPSCGLLYNQACGGCMMYKCSHCSFEFCGFCSTPIKRGKDCSNNSCESRGQHAHHPYSCLFFLRDKDISELQLLLDEESVTYLTIPPKDQIVKSRCQVREQKHVHGILTEDRCGRDIVPYCAGLCRTHYYEYLAELLRQHKIKPLPMMTTQELQFMLRKSRVVVPERVKGETNDEYYNRLTKIVSDTLT